MAPQINAVRGKTRWIGCGGLLLVILLTVFWCAGTYVNAYVTLQAFGDRLFGIALPPNTTVVDRRLSYVTSQEGNCMAAAAITVVSGLSRAALETYYYDPTLVVARDLPLIRVRVDEPIEDGLLRAQIDIYGVVQRENSGFWCAR